MHNTLYKLKELIMKKDFKSFAENMGKIKQDEQSYNPTNNTNNTTNRTTFDDNKTTEKRTGFEEEINKFSGKSESELMKELFTLANKNRQEGNLNNGELDAFTDQIAPYLTAEQKARLDMLINQLKG